MPSLYSSYYFTSFSIYYSIYESTISSTFIVPCYDSSPNYGISGKLFFSIPLLTIVSVAYESSSYTTLLCILSNSVASIDLFFTLNILNVFT